MAFLWLSVQSAGAVDLRGAVPTGYRYNLKWSPQTRHLIGTGAVSVRNNGPSLVSDLWLTIRANRGEKIAAIHTVTGARLAGGAAAGNLVRLVLPRPLAVNAKATVRFHYKLSLRRDNTSLGRSLGVDLFGDALPTLAVAGPRDLRLGAEPAYGEGSFNPVANWRVRVSSPRGLSAAMPGTAARSIRGGATSTLATARVRDFAFAIGRPRSRVRTVDGVKIRVLAAAGDERQLKLALERATYAFRAIQGWYGGYELPQLDVVIGDFAFGGSEFPGIVFSTPDLATISHEVAHQWFYGLVGNDQYFEPWLDESLAAYTEQRLAPSYSCNEADPLDGYSHGLSTSMQYWSRHVRAYEHTIYRGGACALYVLQRDLGSTTVDQALRSYVATNANGIADTRSFLAAVAAAAPSYDLTAWQRLVGLRP